MTDFMRHPQCVVKFETWSKHYEDIFRVNLVDKDNRSNVRLLLQNIRDVPMLFYLMSNQIEHLARLSTRNRNFCNTFSLFNTLYHCPKPTKHDATDLAIYTVIVNRECSMFKFGVRTEDQFRCLIFICGAQSANHSDWALTCWPRLNSKRQRQNNWWMRAINCLTRNTIRNQGFQATLLTVSKFPSRPFEYRSQTYVSNWSRPGHHQLTGIVKQCKHLC